MIELKVQGNNFHDGIVRQISLDFHDNLVRLLIEQKVGNDFPSILIELVFNGVVWQHIQDFHQFNLIRSIEVSNSFDDFQKREAEFLLRMKNYFPTGTLETIEANKNLAFYYINASTGFDGFIICQNLDVINK